MDKARREVGVDGNNCLDMWNPQSVEGKEMLKQKFEAKKERLPDEEFITEKNGLIQF